MTIHPHVQKLLKLLSFPSFNVMFDKESGGPNYQATKTALEYLQSIAPSAEHNIVEFDEYPEFPKKVPNLISVWIKGTYIPGVTKCMLISGHVDVVLANAAEWSHDPFAGDIVDGYIIGRGVTDMKGGTMSLVISAEEAMTDPTIENMVIIGVFSGDEEAMALNGAKHAFGWVHRFLGGFKPQAALIAEPASKKIFADQYGDGRPGLIGGYFDFTGVSGHSGAGNFINPITLGCNVMAGLEAHEFKPHPDPLWTHRTSFQPMSAQAAHLFNVNVVPESAAFAWSIRFAPNYTAKQLTKLVAHKAFNTLLQVSERWDRQGMPVPEIDIVVLTNYEEIKAYEEKLKAGKIKKPTIKLVSREDIHAMPYGSEAGRLAASIKSAVKARFGFTPNAVRDKWSSDARFIQLYFKDENGNPIETIEFGTSQNGLKPDHPRFGLEGGMHQVNEALLIEDYLNQIELTKDIFRRFFARA